MNSLEKKAKEVYEVKKVPGMKASELNALLDKCGLANMGTFEALNIAWAAGYAKGYQQGKQARKALKG